MNFESPHDWSSTPADRWNARLGLWLFLLYSAFYAAFVGLCVFDLDAMGRPIAGMNLAVWYGFGLIVGAFVLAVVYLIFSRD